MLPFTILPFEGGLSATPNGFLVFSIGAALFYGLVLGQAPNARRTIVKTLSIGLLAVLAFQVGGPMMLVCALAFSAIGDAFLAHDGDKAFMGGLASFLIAHIFYIVVFLNNGNDFSILMFEPLRLVAVVAMLAFCGFMLIKLMPKVGALAIPVAAYITVITVMGVCVMTLDKPLAILGAIMFIASDAILSTEKFLMTADNPNRSISSIAIWALYYGGQLLIALAFLV